MEATRRPAAAEAGDRDISDDVRLLHSLGYAQELRAADERVLQLRDLVLDHLHPGRRHHLFQSASRRRRGLDRHRLAARLPVLPDRRAARWARSPRPTRPPAASITGASILGGRGWGWATAWFNLLGLDLRGRRGECRRLDVLSPEPARAAGSGSTRPPQPCRSSSSSRDHGLPGAVQSLRHPRDHPADRLQRLPDLCRRDRPDGGAAWPPRRQLDFGAAGHLRQLHRRCRRRTSGPRRRACWPFRSACCCRPTPSPASTPRPTPRRRRSTPRAACRGA